VVKGAELATGRTPRRRGWWLQFPAPLREVATLRLVGSLGAGGVLYLTPMVFHQQAFSAASVTQGVALAALAGTVSRFLSGWMLDRGVNCSLPVLLAALASFGGDALLFQARDFGGYLQGQLLFGMAMGLYWPAIELAVPLSCRQGQNPVPSARGYALARSADAAGIAGGALFGTLLASLGLLRGIYLVDMLCLSGMVLLLLLRPLPDPDRRHPGGRGDGTAGAAWLGPLLPVLAVALLATALPALMQSALPLDLVRGGLERKALPESLGAALIALKLGLLVLIQWPVGRALARHPVRIGLGLSLGSFAIGTALLGGSALSSNGVTLVVLAQIPLALGEAAFLPVASEAVVEITPPDHRGVAMALFSQCFALSALGAPLLAGMALDHQGHGLGVWWMAAALCSVGLALVQRIRPRPAVAA
jgi:MFS family permease